MRQFNFLTLALLIGVAQASAQAGSKVETEIENLSIRQLCEMQGSSDAVAELERRESFSGRELRAIRKEKAKSGISLEALECAIGMPERIVLYRAVPGTKQFEEYGYSRPGMPDLLVRTTREEGRSIVKGVVKLSNERPGTRAMERFPPSYLSSYSSVPWYGSGRDDVVLQQPEWDNKPYQLQWSTDSLLKRYSK